MWLTNVISNEQKRKREIFFLLIREYMGEPQKVFMINLNTKYCTNINLSKINYTCTSFSKLIS